MSDATAFPQWPTGFWRRIVLWPQAGWIGAALEDDIHRFRMRFDHDGERIARVSAETVRKPWSACPGAADHIAGELPGELLSDVASRDPALHCTHLFDLAVLMADHAADRQPIRFDIRVADRVDDRTTASLDRDGQEVMRWELNGTAIEGNGPHAGRNLRQLSRWKQELSPEDAEHAAVLRRGIFVSGVRMFNPPPGLRAIDQGPGRMGVCYNYQMPQAETSIRPGGRLPDFSAGDGEPLAGLDPVEEWGAT